MATLAPEKKAVFVVSEKGGSGKSTFSRGFIHTARSAGKALAAYDCDGRNGSTFQFYGSRSTDDRRELLPDQDPLEGCAAFNIRSTDERRMLLNALDYGGDVILFDCPGGVIEELGRVGGGTENLFEAYREEGYTPVIVLVLTHKKPSALAVDSVIPFAAQGAVLIAVKNLGAAPTEKFRIFDGTRKGSVAKWGKARQRFEAAGGRVIDMPKLDEDADAAIDESDLPFAEAVKPGVLERPERLYTRQWVNAFRDAVTIPEFGL